jgi:organic hydroperoxide reductase OsmC/OhrA
VSLRIEDATLVDPAPEGATVHREATVHIEDGRIAEIGQATPEADEATNPEELLAAAHASCFAMTAAYLLDASGYNVVDVDAVFVGVRLHLALDVVRLRAG